MSFQLPSILYDIGRSWPASIALPMLGGAINGRITAPSVKTWYTTLRQPPGKPPNVTFPIVWNYLYCGMGISYKLAVNALDKSPSVTIRAAASTAVKLWWLQFGLNLIWSSIFFKAHKTGTALIDILALWGSAVALTPKLAQVDRRTLWFSIPYVSWLTYATYLNAGIWYLNRPSKPAAATRKSGGPK